MQKLLFGLYRAQFISEGMQPEGEGWGDQRDKKLPMEPTRAPWARDGPNHLDVRSPHLSVSSQMDASSAPSGGMCTVFYALHWR